MGGDITTFPSTCAGGCVVNATSAGARLAASTPGSRVVGASHACVSSASARSETGSVVRIGGFVLVLWVRPSPYSVFCDNGRPKNANPHRVLRRRSSRLTAVDGAEPVQVAFPRSALDQARLATTVVPLVRRARTRLSSWRSNATTAPSFGGQLLLLPQPPALRIAYEMPVTIR